MKQLNYPAYKTEGVNRIQAMRFHPFTFTGKDPRKGWRIPLDEIKYNEQRDEEKEMSGGHFASERGEEPRSGILHITTTYVQHIQYLPYGEPYINQRLSGYNERFRFTGNDPRKGWRIPLDEIKYNEQRDEEKEMSGGHFASERGEEPRSRGTT